MKITTVKLSVCRFQVLTNKDRWLGIGKVWIGKTLVRSGRLPIRATSQSWKGVELDSYKFLGIDQNDREVRIRLEAGFTPMRVKFMRDHSFDPIHETGDWDHASQAETGRLDVVFKAAADCFEGHEFRGLSYHYEYNSDSVPLFHLLDQASWEIDGDVTGSTVYNQSACSDPVVELTADMAWSTEGVLPLGPDCPNPVMTHNLPRWASHQAFDFQFKGDTTLIGVYERVDLIRTILCREAGKAELKCFDKHIFDQANSYKTSPKKILISTKRKTLTDQKNLWTWIFDAVANRARAEFALREEPMIPRLAHNYWRNFTVDRYRQDVLPAARSLGLKQLFIDNMNKSAVTQQCPNPAQGYLWNMCCGHEYEIAPSRGGQEMLQKFVDDCSSEGIGVFAWTNNDQAYSSPLHNSEVEDERAWFVRMEDTRLKYGGAYTGCFAILDFKKEAPRQYWVDSLKKIKDQTGLNGYLFDSFYNLGFMPVNYHLGKCTTQWRELLQAFKELQDHDIHFLIESFGPWGVPQHGCPPSYNVENIHVCYKVNLGTGYTTIPGGQELGDQAAETAAILYYTLAHMAHPQIPLHVEVDGRKVRIDKVWGESHRQAIKDYNDNWPHMVKRILQEDGKSVLWHDREETVATLWNFQDREVAIEGRLRDLTEGKDLPGYQKSYQLKACHTYAIRARHLPVAVGEDAPISESALVVACADDRVTAIVSKAASLEASVALGQRGSIVASHRR